MFTASFTVRSFFDMLYLAYSFFFVDATQSDLLFSSFKMGIAPVNLKDVVDEITPALAEVIGKLLSTVAY